ncbi:hypothetical protein Zmor_009193 [Zophobas morio]|uniref:HMG box domain-containing protein n=1 Tax=Zophobas morio TaxID=2755281 RepID=A0AA38IK84_9CUCU|nr:hypothetical protein Zmor_009193 [Zophobas morio]
MDKKNITKQKKKEPTPQKSPPIYRNPFLNFLQEYRKKNVGVSGRELIQNAGELWRKMTDAEKAPYYEMAKKAPRRRRHRRRKRRQHDESDRSGSRSSTT